MSNAPLKNQIPTGRKSVRHPRDAAPLTTLFRIELLRRALTVRDVADRLGVSDRWLGNWVGLGCPKGLFAYRVEAALDFTFSLHSRPKELRLRQACLKYLNFDPFVESRPQLVARAQSLGLKTALDASLPTLRDAIVRWLAANPNKLSRPNPTPTP